MSRARSVADLGNQSVLDLNANTGTLKVGTGVTIENTGEAQFVGIVTADQFAGDIVGATGTFSGNVSIGGTLTYEDVTNIDSVGIITAQAGIRVTGGSVGIGTDTPGDNLEIKTDAHGEGLTVKSTGSTSNAVTFDANRSGGGQSISNVYGRWNGTTVAQMGFVTGVDTTNKNDGYIYFGTESDASNGNVNAIERLRIDSSGQVILNNSASSGDATILRLTGGTSGSSVIEMGDTADTDIGQIAYYHGTTNAMAFRVNASEALRITSGGLMGLGANNPEDYDGEANDLVVRSGNHTGITIASSGSNQRCNLYFSDGTSGSEKYRGAFTYDHNDDSMMMRTAGAERLRIDSSGRVLAGLTTSVDSNSTLQVEGRNTITAIRYSAATGNAGSKLELSRSASNTVGTTAAVSATDELGEIRFRGASTGSAFNTGAVISAVITSGTISASSFPTDLLFKTTNNGAASATEKLRITSGGNVIIGAKSDPAWASTVDALTIGYAGVLYEDSYTSGNDNYLILGNNTFYNVATGGNTRIRSDEASRLMMQAGNFWFQSAGSAAAGSAITFADRLKITSGGDVEIGDGNLKLAAGYGIQFGASNTGTNITSQTLDDYEEGTWTPVMNKSGATGVVSGYNANSQLGYYRKVGSLLYISFYMYKSSGSFGTGVGQWYVSGLPFSLLTLIPSAYQFIPGGYMSINGSGYNFASGTGTGTASGVRWQANSTNGAATLAMYGVQHNTNWTSGALEVSGAGVLMTT